METLEEEFNNWLCDSDELIGDLMVDGQKGSDGLMITIDNNSYKISK